MFIGGDFKFVVFPMFVGFGVFQDFLGAVFVGCFDLEHSWLGIGQLQLLCNGFWGWEADFIGFNEGFFGQVDVKVQLEALVDGLTMLKGSIRLLDVASWDVGLVIDVGVAFCRT